MANSTLIVSLAGIGVSGVIGPAATGWATRRASRLQFERDRAGRRRDDLAALVDEAATLLAAGGTNLRLAAAAETAGTLRPREVDEWLSAVFPLQQRILLRCPANDPIAVGYDTVRQRLLSVMRCRLDTEEYETALREFEAERDGFLDAARRRLSEPV